MKVPICSDTSKVMCIRHGFQRSQDRCDLCLASISFPNFQKYMSQASRLSTGYHSGMRLAIRALLLGSIALTFVGCGAEPSASVVTDAFAESVPTDENDVTSRVIGQGGTFSLKEAVAETPVAFWFWAPG